MSALPTFDAGRVVIKTPRIRMTDSGAPWRIIRDWRMSMQTLALANIDRPDRASSGRVPRLAHPVGVRWTILLILFTCTIAVEANAQEKWAAAWTASPQGPYPSGAAVAQPDLRFVFPDPSVGADNQTFRLMVRPDLWSPLVRLRFSNAFGSQAVSFDGVFVGIQRSGGNLVGGTNRPVTFHKGQAGVSIPPGKSVYSDPVELPFVKRADGLEVAGRRLAVSFHVVGKTGPMTWHAKAMVTSYVTARSAGARGNDDTDAAFPFTTTSWYFLDAVEMMAPRETIVIAAFGDSITDGSLSTLNGDDRWSDFLSTRLHAAWGPHVAVVNQGIGANQVIGPSVFTTSAPYMGGPSALQRLERDILGIAGLNAVIWLEGINDFGMGTPPPSVDALIAGLLEGTRRLHARGIKVIVGTLTTSLNSGDGSTGHGTREVDAKRKAVNAFIRGSGSFDGVVDFDAAVLDAATGMLRAEFQPGSTGGGPGDRIHPNRAGYQAMANAIDLTLLAKLVGRTR
jgi:lysophospholipase L1-like esterase